MAVDFDIIRRTSDKRILRGGFLDLSGDVGAGEALFSISEPSSDFDVLESVGFELDQVKFDGGDNIVLKTAGELNRRFLRYKLTDDAVAHDAATGFPELVADGASFFTVTIQKIGEDGTELTDAGDTETLELKSTGGFITDTSGVSISSIALVLGTAQFRFNSTRKTHAAQIQVISDEEDATLKVTTLGVFLKDGGISDTAGQGLVVRTISTSNLTLSGEQTVNGVALVASDLVLVLVQTDDKENGPYVVDAGAWTRAPGADTNNEFNEGLQIFAKEGTISPRTFWILKRTPNPIDVGVSDIFFVLGMDEKLPFSTNSLDITQQDKSNPTLDGLRLEVRTGTVPSATRNTAIDASDPTGLRVKVDGATIGGMSSLIGVANSGITSTQIAASALGQGMQGGAGSDVEVKDYIFQPEESKPLQFRFPVGATVVEVAAGDAVALEMADGVTTELVATIILPKRVKLNVSFPFVLRLAFVVTSAGAGNADVRMQISRRWVADTENIASGGSSTTQAQTEAVVDSVNRLHYFLVSYNIASAADEDHLVFKVERLGADGLDTFTGRIGLINVAQVTYTKRET